jgi:hypothetical protein
MTRYALHGLVVDSDLAIHAPIAPVDHRTDVRVRAVSAVAWPPSESSQVLYDQRFEGHAWHQVIQASGRTLVAFHGVALFLIGEKFDSIEYQWISDAPEHLGPILFEGYVMALLLALRGKCVLHASAVALADGRALALVGPSGAGKTTLATLLTAGGKKHLADDIVGVDLSHANVAMIASGSRAIRLREKAWDLQHLLPSTRQSLSVDHRLVLEDVNSEPSDHPLAAIWLPVPDRTVNEVTIEPIDTLSAFRQILPNLRVELNDSGYRRRSFEAIIELTRRVPTFVARIPWGPPWLRETIEELGVAADRL